MIDACIVNEIIKNMDGEYFEIVRKYDVIDALWGLDNMILTDNDIKALKEGNYLYSTNGEYTQIISYVSQKDEV